MTLDTFRLALKNFNRMTKSPSSNSPGLLCNEYPTNSRDGIECFVNWKY